MRFILSLLLLLFIPGIVVAFSYFLKVSVSALNIFVPVMIGIILGLLGDHFVFRKFKRFETFEHELTHALAAFLFFRKVNKFVATKHHGGYVSHSGGFGGVFGDDFIGLAPYLLPTFTVILVLIRPLIGVNLFPWFDVTIGFTFGFHTISTLKETKQNWNKKYFVLAGTEKLTKSDIGRRGYLYSFIFITSVTLGIHAVLISIIVMDYQGISFWGKKVWIVTLNFWEMIIHLF